ncbi:MAG: SGNH/GDSL hydrolase family protein [Pseudomonadota bacterium]
MQKKSEPSGVRGRIGSGPAATGNKGAPVAHGPREGGWRNGLVNAALMISSILVMLLLCELVLFRFILIPSDVPENVFVDGLVRLRPGSEGVWRVGDDVAGHYRINAQGWNSGRATYDAKAPSGVRRIAIIGDSFVEALQAPFDASLAEQLEGAAKDRLQVYRFGISGAPLSHYLAMARHVAQTYHPDMIVMVLVHNDFDESFSAVAGRYTSSFLKFRMDGNQVAGEIPPVPYQSTWRDWLRQTATLRYLYYRQRLNPAAMIMQMPPAAPPAYQANVAVDAVTAQRAAIRGATRYAFAQFQALSREHHFRPLLMMDGDRRSIVSGVDSMALYRDGALWLNAMAAEVAAKAGLTFIDLHPLFQKDWQMNHQPLNFVSDNHWNERGHRVAAQALEAYVLDAKP